MRPRPYLLVVREPEKRNQYTGLPEAAFYRPPDPKNIRAAKNALGVMLIGFLLALPAWFVLTQEAWPQILHQIERVVAK